MAITKLCFIVAVLTLCQTVEGYMQKVVGTGSNCLSSSVGSGVEDLEQPCVDINQAMDELASNTYLFLMQGTHFINRSRIAYDMSNVSLIGAYESGVYLTCDGETGLGFVNVTGLIIANVTIDGCGLDRDSLLDAMDYVREIVDIWFLVPQILKIGLFLGHCQDLTMSYVCVNGTRGLGMLAINTVGDSVLSHVNFTHNVRQNCLPGDPFYPFDITPKIVKQIGGGAYFLYHDYLNESNYNSMNNTLLISDSYFAYNADCSFSTLTHLNYKYLGNDVNRFTVGAGGGLSIIYAHSNYSLATNVESTIFYRNDARYGSGAYIGTFANFIYPNFVVFSNCTFMENGLASAAVDGGFTKAYCRSGAGLAVFTDLLKPDNLQRAISYTQKVSISAFNTDFVRNKAEIEGGGVFAFSLVNSPHKVNSLLLKDYFSVEWRLASCTFQQNQARLASAASFVQRTFHSVDGIVILYLDSVMVSKNGVLSEDEISSAVSLKNVVTEFQGDSLFADNYVSAVHVISSFCHVMPGSTLEFERNIGKRGGALYIEGNSPALFITENVTIAFRENVALVEGGAVYIGNPPYTDIALQPLNYFDCVVNVPPLSDLDFLSSGNRFEFYGNSAPVGGMVFGSTFEFCTWSAQLNVSLEGNLLAYLYDNNLPPFVFDRRPVGKDQVSTQGARIEVSGPDEVIPGEQMDISINVFDHFGNEIYAVVTSEVHDSSETSMLGDSGFWYTSKDNTTVRIFGPQNRTLDVSYFTFGNVIRTSVEMSLLSCPAGFEHSTESDACVCAKEVFGHSHSEVVHCDPLSMTISTTSDNWVGTDLHLINSTDLDNLIIHDCHFDYCQLNTTFRPPNFDAQCKVNSHRTGVLCGGCMANYSVVFGTSDCKICSNYYLFSILIFAIAGILVFLAIAFLEFTIDKGWLNAVLFYCNIVTLYSFSAFPENPNLHFSLLPAHLLSLELGFSLCFEDGMTALSRSFYQFLFPVYLYVLMIIFAILSRRYSLSCYFSPAKTFLTITVLCYVSLLNTCIEILAGHSIHTIRDVESVRWLIDANQLYFRGFHAVLGVIALVILICHGVFTVLILFPPVVYRLVKSGKPLYDALYAPFKQRYRFWIGLRLFARALIITIAKFSVTSMSLVINLVLLMTLLHIQTNIQPYKSKWLNFVDSYLIVNAIILYIGTLAKLQVTYSTITLTTYTALYACAFLGMAYLVIALVFGWHIDRRFPNIRAKIIKHYRALKTKKAYIDKRRSMLQPGNGVTTASIEDMVDDPRQLSPEHVVPLSRRQDAAWDEVEQDRYRDSILDTIS